jgi:hypothetical protein
MKLDANDFFAGLSPDPEFLKWESSQPKPADPFPCMTARQILHAQVPPRRDFVGEAMVYPGAVFSLVGPAGTGKTRFIIQMACCSLSGTPLGPLQCPQVEQTWLILAGNENSVNRYKTDLRAMLHHFPAESHERILSRVVCHVAEEYDDYIGPDSHERIALTVEAHGGPEVGIVVYDPTGDLIKGDANADADLRSMLRLTGSAVRRASRQASVGYIHHAREGRINISQAVGWDKGNYGKGSKALHAAVRAAFNLAPMDKEHTGIVVACGKCNDARPFETFGMKLVDGVYQLDPAFDLDSWSADVEGKRSPGQKCSIQDIVDFLATAAGGKATQREIKAHFGVSLDTVNRRISAGEKAGILLATNKGVKSTGKQAPREPVEHSEEEI